MYITIEIQTFFKIDVLCISDEKSHTSWGGIFSLDTVRSCFEVCTLSEKGYDTYEKMPLKKSYPR
jgi:hypothetical protein